MINYDVSVTIMAFSPSDSSEWDGDEELDELQGLRRELEGLRAALGTKVRFKRPHARPTSHIDTQQARRCEFRFVRLLLALLMLASKYPCD